MRLSSMYFNQENVSPFHTQSDKRMFCYLKTNRLCDKQVKVTTTFVVVLLQKVTATTTLIKVQKHGNYFFFSEQRL